MVVDFAVVGGGIAGISVGAHLAKSHSVVVLEAEEHPGFHSTGRSAALFSESYGPPLIRALSRASRVFFYAPVPEFADAPLVSRRGFLTLATPEALTELEEFGELAEVKSVMRRLTQSQILAACPVLKRERIGGALLERDAADIDVHGLQSGYLRLMRSRGGILRTSFRVDGISKTGKVWVLQSGSEKVFARTLINAAGAWADVVAIMAGLEPVGLQPKRRTAILVDAPQNCRIEAWPLVYDFSEHFYFKPDAGCLLLSPGDETPTEPGDAQPEELDVAIAVDRFMTATTIDVQHVRSRWAGLRSFVSDGDPVVGYDPSDDGFFWLAGQGGYGIQTAPALSLAAADLAKRKPLSAEISAMGVTVDALSPGRFRQEGSLGGRLGGVSCV